MDHSQQPESYPEPPEPIQDRICTFMGHPMNHNEMAEMIDEIYRPIIQRQQHLAHQYLQARAARNGKWEREALDELISMIVNIW